MCDLLHSLFDREKEMDLRISDIRGKQPGCGADVTS